MEWLCFFTGQDSTMRIFSTVHDKYNKSLGRASFNKTETKRTGLKHDQHKMPPVTVFAAGTSLCVCVCMGGGGGGTNQGR